MPLNEQSSKGQLRTATCQQRALAALRTGETRFIKLKVVPVGEEVALTEREVA